MAELDEISRVQGFFRPLFLTFYLKNLRVHLPYSADWGITVYLICAVIGLGWVKWDQTYV